MFVTVINIVLIISRTVYAIPAWGGFFPADLKSHNHINGFLRRTVAFLGMAIHQLCSMKNYRRLPMATCNLFIEVLKD